MVVEAMVAGAALVTAMMRWQPWVVGSFLQYLGGTRRELPDAYVISHYQVGID